MRELEWCVGVTVVAMCGAGQEPSWNSAVTDGEIILELIGIIMDFHSCVILMK